MHLENFLKPRRQVLAAMAELNRERADRQEAPALSHGGSDHGRGDDDDGEGGGDGGGDGGDGESDEGERMAQRAVEAVKAIYKRLRRELDLISDGELLISGSVTICKDGYLGCDEFELLGEDQEAERDARKLVDKLAEYLESPGRSVAEAARQIGRSPAALYSWLSHRAEPSQGSCERLEAFLAKRR